MSKSGSATPTQNYRSVNASLTPPTSRSKRHDRRQPPTPVASSSNPSLRAVDLGSSQEMVASEFKTEDEREENSRSSPSCSSHEDGAVADTEEAERSQCDNSAGPSTVKKKRTRTLTTPHQSAVLHALLAQVRASASFYATRVKFCDEKSRFPTTAMREEVGRSIGLSARKVQIWFQNQRQKARRPRSQSAAPLSRPPQYAAFPNASASSIPMAGDYYSYHQPRGYHHSSRDLGFDRQFGYPPYRLHRSSDASRTLDSNQLSGPGIPGIDPRYGYLYSDRDLPPSPPHSMMVPGGPYRSFRTRHHPDFYDRPTQSPPVSHSSSSRPGTGYSNSRYERDMSRTLPPLNFDAPHLRTGFTSPILAPPQNSSMSYSPSAEASFYEHHHRESASYSPFAYKASDHGDHDGYNISRRYVLEPRPQWDTSSRAWDPRPGSSSVSGPPSRGLSTEESSPRGYDPRQRPASTDHQSSVVEPPSLASRQSRRRSLRANALQEEAESTEPASARVGRYDPVRGMFVSNRTTPPPPSSETASTSGGKLAFRK